MERPEILSRFAQDATLKVEGRCLPVVIFAMPLDYAASRRPRTRAG